MRATEEEHTGSPPRIPASPPAAAPSRRRAATFTRADAPQRSMAAFYKKESPSEVRTVRPHSNGGWRVGVGARTVAKTATKAEAIKRAREIVRKAGGGEVVLHDRSDNRHKVLRVPSGAANV